MEYCRSLLFFPLIDLGQLISYITIFTFIILFSNLFVYRSHLKNWGPFRFVVPIIGVESKNSIFAWGWKKEMFILVSKVKIGFSLSLPKYLANSIEGHYYQRYYPFRLFPISIMLDQIICTSTEKCYLWRVEWGVCGSLLFFPSLRITHLLLLHIITSQIFTIQIISISYSPFSVSIGIHGRFKLYSKICTSSPPQSSSSPS